MQFPLRRLCHTAPSRATNSCSCARADPKGWSPPGLTVQHGCWAPPCWHTGHPPQNLIFPIRLRLLQSTHADPSLQDKVIIAQVPKERDED